MSRTARRSAPPACGLRADAELNRNRLLVAARQVFAEEGIEAPLAEVARRAGVGIATLFRRFPERNDLITATFADTMATYVRAIETALADADPWLGFCTYIETICEMQSADLGFMEVLTMSFPTDKSFEADRQRAYVGVTALIARAQEVGRLRADFTAEDVILVLMANAGVVSAMAKAAPDAWRRLVGLLLQSFAAESAAPLPDPPTPRQVYRALLRLQPRRS